MFSFSIGRRDVWDILRMKFSRLSFHSKIFLLDERGNEASISWDERDDVIKWDFMQTSIMWSVVWVRPFNPTFPVFNAFLEFSFSDEKSLKSVEYYLQVSVPFGSDRKVGHKVLSYQLYV